MTQIKILSHETKIATKIELFSYLPGVDSPNDLAASVGVSTLITPQNSNLLFNRLGHFSLDSNASTGFQSRELKTVHLGVNCQFFKLVLHKNHENKLNLFN